MNDKKFGLFVMCLIFCMLSGRAQDKTIYKFGKISPADFNLETAKFDSGASAVIIADVGNTSFEGNDKGSFTLIFTRFIRVKIMNRNGFDLGSQNILLYHNSEGDFEKLTSLKGSTFNLENGVVNETKLDEKSVFNEKYNKNYDSKKFSMPALKEGSIFDLVYKIKSPFDTEMRSWEFQGKYPRLWSEYEVTIPPTFHYVMKLQGEENFDVNTTEEIPVTYSIRYPHGIVETGGINLNSNSVNKHWVKKNVPALHEEAFTTSISNYYSRVSFQLNYFQWSKGDEKHDYLATWNLMAKTLKESEDFGKALDNANNWISDELKGIIQSSEGDEEKTRLIFNYMRDNFKAVNKQGLSKGTLFVQTSLKDVFQKREGNVAEINLLLTATLRKAGIRADPLILSTRENGIANTGYPLISEYNYVICIAYPQTKLVALDASEPYNGYGQLPVTCYNGWGHIINEGNPLPIIFSADSMFETSITNVVIVNDDKGKLSGRYKSILGKSKSYNVRSEIGNSSEKVYEKKIQTSNGSVLDMEYFGIDSLEKFDFPLAIHYDFDIKNSTGDILYINPLLNEGYKTNPFKSMDRHYPVEIPYKIDETYLLNMDIPTGYQVDELPKSARVAYNGNDGMFEYLIQKSDNSLQMRVHLKFNKAFFPVEEYGTLRDFFAFVVKKESEQIVFKKIH
jgi:Domain of Unknown Function with PDB structure (DUF3858)